MAFFSSYGDFTTPCTLSPLPACYVTNTTYTGCLSNPAAAAAIQPAGLGAVVMSALVFLETAAFAGYLGYQQAWIGRRERSVLFFLVSTATLFQTVVYGGAGFASPAIGVLSSVFIAFMNAAYTSLIAVGIIGYNWVPEGGLRAMMISIGSSGVVFLVAMMISLTSSLGWSVPPATPHYSSGVFFMFFIWPLICMSVFACLQLYVLFRLYWSWRTAVALIGAFLMYGASFVLVFPFSSTICTSTSQSVSGVFLGVLLQFVAYGLLFVYFQQTSQDGWDTTMVVFDDVVPGDPGLAVDTRRRAAAAAGNYGAPVPPPKDDAAVGGYYGYSAQSNSDPFTSYYDDPHI